MSAIIMMRIIVGEDKITDFIKAIAWKHLVITDIRTDTSDDEDNDIEFMIQPEQIGYAEPVDLYHEIKEYVKDIWYLIVGDTDLIPNKDCKDKDCLVWVSCKKEYKLEDWKNENFNTFTKR